MKSSLNSRLVFGTICLVIFAFILESSSLASEGQIKPESAMLQLAGDSTKHKSIFLFLDGTANDSSSGTNVWRLYDIISKNNDPHTTALYIDGVGSVEKPLFGKALGLGMEERMLKGYEFVAKNYNDGDDVFIFGFSRGAHQARSLAGLLAYAGVPKTSDTRHNLIKVGNSIFELLKEKTDEDYKDKWANWKPGQAPMIAAEINNKLKLDMKPVEVKFLGVWDTVPGSSFKKYNDCREKIGFWKKYFYWLPMISKGNRYKTDSYPPIRQIVHAVSLDEKRSKFEPLLLCPPSTEYTRIAETWFPGAHADVGGGYDDSNELPNISLNWILGILAENYKFKNLPPTIKEYPKGLAHWSMGDSPANLGSECKDRQPYPKAQIHPSVIIRQQSSPVPVCIYGKVSPKTYPIKCEDISNAR